MNQTKKINLQEIDIEGKSDKLIVWDDNLFGTFEKWRKEKEGTNPPPPDIPNAPRPLIRNLNRS